MPHRLHKIEPGRCCHASIGHTARDRSLKAYLSVKVTCLSIFSQPGDGLDTCTATVTGRRRYNARHAAPDDPIASDLPPVRPTQPFARRRMQDHARSARTNHREELLLQPAEGVAGRPRKPAMTLRSIRSTKRRPSLRRRISSCRSSTIRVLAGNLETQTYNAMFPQSMGFASKRSLPSEAVTPSLAAHASR